jgi:hypothetical protein
MICNAVLKAHRRELMLLPDLALRGGPQKQLHLQLLDHPDLLSRPAPIFSDALPLNVRLLHCVHQLPRLHLPSHDDL